MSKVVSGFKPVYLADEIQHLNGFSIVKIANEKDDLSRITDTDARV